MQQRTIIRLTVLTIILIILQILMVHNLRIFYLAMPLLFTYPILKFPPNTSRLFIIIFSFVVGAIMDMAMNTPGLNMAATTLIGFVRTPILQALTKEEQLDEEGATIVPSFATYPWGRYLTYLSVMVVIHATALFLLEAFSIQLFAHTIPYIIGSAIVTITTFLIFEAFGYRRKRA